MKKVISFVLVFIMTLAMLPAQSASAAIKNYAKRLETYQFGKSYTNYRFNIDKNGMPLAEIELSYGMQNGKEYYLYDGVSGKLLKSFEYDDQSYETWSCEYGKNYTFAIFAIKYETTEDIKNAVEGVNPAETELNVPKLNVFSNDISASVSSLQLTSPFIDRIDFSYYCDGPHAIYIDGKFIRSNTENNDFGNKEYFKTGFKPNSKHTIKIRPFTTINGKNYVADGIEKTVTVAPLTSPSKPSVTKLSSNLVSVRFSVPAAQQKSGISTFYAYAGKKKLKTIKNTGKNTYVFQIKKKGIAKKKIKMVAKAAGKSVSSKASKPAKNEVKFNYPKNVNAYATIKEFARPSKIYYSGNKLVIKGFYINTHILTLKKFKINFKVTVNGKVIGKKKMTIKNMSSKSIKNFTVKMKKKGKVQDLRNNAVYWSYDTLAAQV